MRLSASVSIVEARNGEAGIANVIDDHNMFGTAPNTNILEFQPFIAERRKRVYVGLRTLWINAFENAARINVAKAFNQFILVRTAWWRFFIPATLPRFLHIFIKFDRFWWVEGYGQFRKRLWVVFVREFGCEFGSILSQDFNLSVGLDPIIDGRRIVLNAVVKWEKTNTGNLEPQMSVV